MRVKLRGRRLVLCPEGTGRDRVLAIRGARGRAPSPREPDIRLTLTRTGGCQVAANFIRFTSSRQGLLGLSAGLICDRNIRLPPLSDRDDIPVRKVVYEIT
jgi:hypothetical protein